MNHPYRTRNIGPNQKVNDMHRKTARRLPGKPIIAISTGIALFGAGLIIGRVNYNPVPGGFSQSAAWTDHLCTLAHQIQASAGQTPMCVHAHEAMVGCGALIVLGLGLAVFGIVLAVRRYRARTAAERQAAMQRHPASQSRVAR